MAHATMSMDFILLGSGAVLIWSALSVLLTWMGCSCREREPLDTGVILLITNQVFLLGTGAWYYLFPRPIFALVLILNSIFALVAVFLAIVGYRRYGKFQFSLSSLLRLTALLAIVLSVAGIANVYVASVAKTSLF